MALAAAVEKVASLAFPQMTPMAVRDVTKELVALAGTDAVIERELAALGPDQLDTLMKVIYVGLKGDYKNSAAYLKWHAAVYERGGVGTIVRTLADRGTA